MNWPTVSARFVPPGEELRAWTIATDALARASVAAAAATCLAELQAGSAGSLAGAFADWVFVDLKGCEPERIVAAARCADPALDARLTRMHAQDCPLICAAMRRRQPVLSAAADIPPSFSLGELAAGQPAADVLLVSSAGAAPVFCDDLSPEAIGAITIARCTGHPDIGFVELGILSQVAELAGAAVSRLRRA